MALDEPERNIQVGGLAKPFRVIKKAAKGLKDLGRRITTTLKATKKKKPVVKYSKKVSLIERIRILKEKAAAKKKALATKVQGAVKKVISSVSVAAKQAAKKVATSTRRVVSSIDTKTKYAKAKINTLKKVAMAKAVKIASALRTRLLQSSASSRNTAITKLKTKLLYIRNLRNNKILGSKRGAAGDIMGNNSLNHGISGISFVNSFRRIGDSNLRRNNASDNIGPLNGRKSVISGDIPQQTTNRVTISDGLGAIGIRRDRAKGDAREASTKAGTARVDAAANLSGINTNRANRNTIAASIQPIMNQKAKRQNDAADAKRVADSSDGVRRSAGDTAVRRQQDRAANDSGRKNATRDSQAQVNNINTATGRKAANETNLADIQNTHQTSMTRLQLDADGSVTGGKKSLDDVGSSRNKLTGDADTAAQARMGVEADSAANTRASKAKEGEVASSMSAEGNAKSKNNADAADVKRNKDNLDQQLGSEPTIRSDRNSSLNNAEASRPVRSRDTDTFISRKNTINDVEIPNKRAARNTAEGKLGDMNIDMNGPGGTRNRRAAGDAELQAVSNNKVGLANKDGALRNKLDTEKLNIDGAKAQKKRIDDTIELSMTKRTERGQH